MAPYDRNADCADIKTLSLSNKCVGTNHIQCCHSENSISYEYYTHNILLH